MKVDELKAKLKEINISPNSYHLYGPGSGDEYCIEHGPNGWTVYYHERGNKSIIGKFSREEDACECFLKSIIKDPTTRIS